jgi:type I restriction enzyme M protein
MSAGQRARLNLDRLLTDAGWSIRNTNQINLGAAQGVKANVLFLERRTGGERARTKDLWIYDLRTNMHFTLKQSPLSREALDDFVACYNPANRHERTQTWSETVPDGRWRRYTYNEIAARDKFNLDIFWLRDESLEDSANLPAPDIIAAEIIEDLQAALEQFQEIITDLQPQT